MRWLPGGPMRRLRRPARGPELVLISTVTRGHHDMIEMVLAHLNEFGSPRIDPRSHLILALVQGDDVAICTCPRGHVRRLFRDASPEYFAEIVALTLSPLPLGSLRVMTIDETITDEGIDEVIEAADFAPLVANHA